MKAIESSHGPLIKSFIYPSPNTLEQTTKGPLIRHFLKKPETPIFINTIFVNNGLDIGLQGLRNKLEENIKPKDPLSDQPKGRERFWDNFKSSVRKTAQAIAVGAIAFSALTYTMINNPTPEVKGDITPIVQTPTSTSENKSVNASTPALEIYSPPAIIVSPVSQEQIVIQTPQEKLQTIIQDIQPVIEPIEQVKEDETIQIPNGSNPWREAHLMFLKKRGFEPSNTQIMNATIAFVEENDIEVNEWKIIGSISDRKISPYQTFKATGLIKRVLQD